MIRACLTGWIAFLLVLGAITVTAAHATTNNAAPRLAASDDPDPIEWPDSPCNLEHRMDVAIVGGLFFECTCVRLQVGYQCDWQIIAGTISASHRRVKHPVKPRNRHAIGTAVISVKRVAA